MPPEVRALCSIHDGKPVFNSNRIRPGPCRKGNLAPLRARGVLTVVAGYAILLTSTHLPWQMMGPCALHRGSGRVRQSFSVRVLPAGALMKEVPFVLSSLCFSFDVPECWFGLQLDYASAAGVSDRHGLDVGDSEPQ